MLRDILRETPAYQQLLAEGREEGREKERQTRLQSLRNKLLNLVQTRFPKLMTLTKKQISLIKQPEILEDLMLNVALAPNAEEAKEALKAWKEPEAP